MAPTNKEVGRRVGYNHTTISRLRSGTRRPSVTLLIRLCKEYGLDQAEGLKAMERDEARADQHNTEFATWLKANVFGERTAA